MTLKIKQKRIGLTGGIGSGKTYVSDIFKKLEIPVFNADDAAKRCMVENERLQQEIQNVFGDEVYNNGALQNKVLAEIVFNDEQKLEKLNKLVHPVVKKSFEDWCAEQNSDIIIKEAAILFESNTNTSLDIVICVSAPEEIRIERVINRDNISRAQVVAIIENQMPQHEKEKLSNFVIINDEKELLLTQILDIITQIS